MTLLLLHGPLSRGERLQSGVRDRGAALHGKSVATSLHARFGALDGSQLLAQILGPASVEFVLIEILGPLIARLDAIRTIERALLGESSKRLFNIRALTREQLTGAVGVHRASVSDPPPGGCERIVRRLGDDSLVATAVLHDFFAASASVAAALIGLLLVAISVAHNPEDYARKLSEMGLETRPSDVVTRS